MNITILGFGIARDILGAPQVSLQLADGATVGDMQALLEGHYPRLARLASYMVAVNNEYARREQPLSPTDEIAIIPPVSGG